jgi:hypothetical protein
MQIVHGVLPQIGEIHEDIVLLNGACNLKVTISNVSGRIIEGNKITLDMIRKLSVPHYWLHCLGASWNQSDASHINSASESLLQEC